MNQQMKVEQSGYGLWRNHFSRGSKVPPYPRNGQQMRLVKAIVDAYGSFSVIHCMCEEENVIPYSAELEEKSGLFILDEILLWGKYTLSWKKWQDISGWVEQTAEID